MSELDKVELNQSVPIGNLAASLAIVQGGMRVAAKDANNPFFKKPYSTLQAVWDACRSLLSENGLAVSQLLSNKDDTVVITTILAHKSGEFLKSDLAIKPVKIDPQGMGSAITYGRRYALAAIVGVCSGDDDGEAGMGRGDSGSTKPKNNKRPGNVDQETGEIFEEKKPNETGKTDNSREEKSGKEPEKVSAIKADGLENLAFSVLKIEPSKYGEFLQSYGFKNTAEITKDKFDEIKEGLKNL